MTFLEEIVQRLAETEGDVDAQTAVAAAFVLASHPDAERKPLEAALDAAAVLRWFDADLLKKGLEISDEEAANLFEALKAMPFVEQFRGTGPDLRNVQTSTRRGWRKKLLSEAPELFRLLSARAAACYGDDFTPAGRIEWIYHLLSSDPDRGTSELENLACNWRSPLRSEDRYALTAALSELENTGFVQGRPRGRVLLFIAWTRVIRGETAQLANEAHESLRLAGAASDLPAEAEGQCLLGDVLKAQGKLEAAQAAFAEYLAISRRLAEQDPTQAGSGIWRRHTPGWAVCWRRKASWRRRRRRSKRLSC